MDGKVGSKEGEGAAEEGVIQRMEEEREAGKKEMGKGER